MSILRCIEVIFHLKTAIVFTGNLSVDNILHNIKNSDEIITITKTAVLIDKGNPFVLTSLESQEYSLRGSRILKW